MTPASSPGGDKAFVEGVFKNHRESFGPARKEGAKPLRELEKKAAIFSLRALRVKAVE